MGDIYRARVALLCVTCLYYLIVFTLLPFVEMRVDYSFVKTCFIMSSGALAVSFLFTKMKFETARTFVEVYICSILLIVPITFSVYMAVRLQMPWADDQLMAMDYVFGVWWPGFIRYVDDYPVVAYTLNIAYASFRYQLLVLPLLLALSGRIASAYHFAIIYAAICLVSSIISIWYPALGTYAVHNLDPASLKHIAGNMGVVFIDELVGVRDDPDFIFSLQKVEGIMTFPSVHAGVAVLCAWAAWSMKWFRYPFLVLNCLMGISATIVSNHYVVDIIAGIGVASFCIALVLFAVRYEFAPQSRGKIRSLDRAFDRKL